MKSNRFWIVIICGVMLVSTFATIFLQQGEASQARIYVDGKLIESIDLAAYTEPYTFTVENEYGVNEITVDNGRICVSDADCPDKSCVRQGWIGGSAAPIVCLPHKLVIELYNNETPPVDAIAK